MKLLVSIAFAVVIFSGCVKDSVNPQNNNSTTSTGGGSKTPPDSGSQLSHDDSIHMATFTIAPQAVTASVSGTNLILKFDENVDLLFTAEAYKKTSAVHLKEDFKNTMLAGFDYTTIAEGGNKTLNWVDDNLNNVILKTITNTVINGVSMVRINVHRQFTFFKVYQSNAAALSQQALFASKKDDIIVFSSYSYYNQKNYPPVAASAYLVYSGNSHK